MNKAEIEKELGDLIYRFKVLKKALAEEDHKSLSPVERMMNEIAAGLKVPAKPTAKLTREQVLVKAKELAEQQHAQRLANQLQKSGILGTRPPPRQPTNEEMHRAAQNMYAQANGFSTQEEMNKAESNWGNGINNWLAEAQKPINQRFKNEQEEREYWDRIKINGNGRDEGPGY
jgi:hypothetical protein